MGFGGSLPDFLGENVHLVINKEALVRCYMREMQISYQSSALPKLHVEQPRLPDVQRPASDQASIHANENGWSDPLATPCCLI